uniref:Uncharacterized protein n=1 Tax=Salix viminalis TaxID=40686 RepID=A0A6N2KNU4_SALVM
MVESAEADAKNVFGFSTRSKYRISAADVAHPLSASHTGNAVPHIGLNSTSNSSFAQLRGGHRGHANFPKRCEREVGDLATPTTSFPNSDRKQLTIKNLTEEIRINEPGEQTPLLIWNSISTFSFTSLVELCADLVPRWPSSRPFYFVVFLPLLEAKLVRTPSVTGLLILLLLVLSYNQNWDKHYREKVWSRTKTDFLIPTHFTLVHIRTGSFPCLIGACRQLEIELLLRKLIVGFYRSESCCEEILVPVKIASSGRIYVYPQLHIGNLCFYGRVIKGGIGIRWFDKPRKKHHRLVLTLKRPALLLGWASLYAPTPQQGPGRDRGTIALEKKGVEETRLRAWVAQRICLGYRATRDPAPNPAGSNPATFLVDHPVVTGYGNNKAEIWK